ncbi:DUF488 domain-containing protein [Humisphaera borealis]|uniref:DUF488 family protein n=1 Tax=Humisphaera borealis TaxID=2807512 RepID=A0A7M2WY54_9BACT|nr:DUF488 family protein [Humisphaera borealis]QOV90405.1 DUF488 family protein [Humisphaera borealis]
MATQPIHTRRWNDPPAAADEGTRILVTRYRPRGVAKADETWDEWDPALGPSKELHAAAYGKGMLAIPWETYRTLYLREMRLQKDRIAALAKRVAAGETLTLICSSACDRESRCHRSLLRELIEKALTPPDPTD